MMLATNKAARIRELLSTDLSNKHIAYLVGCDDAYVRSVKQRMIGGRGGSAGDRKWRSTEEYKAYNRASVKAWRLRNVELSKARSNASAKRRREARKARKAQQMRASQ